MTNSFHPPASYRKTFHEFLIGQGLHLVPVFPLKGLMPYDKFVKHWFLSEIRGKLLMNFTPSCILSQSPCLRGRNHFPYALAYELPANHSRLLSQRNQGLHIGIYRRHAGYYKCVALPIFLNSSR